MYSYSELYTYLRAVRYAHKMARAMPSRELEWLVCGIVWAAVVGTVLAKIRHQVRKYRARRKRKPLSKPLHWALNVIQGSVDLLPMLAAAGMLAMTLGFNASGTGPAEPTAASLRSYVPHVPESVVLQDLAVKTTKPQLPALHQRMKHEQADLGHRQATETVNKFQNDKRAQQLQRTVPKLETKYTILRELCKPENGKNTGIQVLPDYALLMRPGHKPKMIKSEASDDIKRPLGKHDHIYNLINYSGLGRGGYVKLPKLKHSMTHFPYLYQ